MDPFIKTNEDNSNQFEDAKTQKSNNYDDVIVEDDELSKTIVNNDINTELEALLAKQKAKIKVVGCGGGGNNTLNRISEVGIKGVETIALNTDAQDLLFCVADRKILIGKELTKGLGAGADPKVGEQAARETETELKQALTGADMVFITCGLGGGTGTGSAHVVAEIAKKMGALTISIITLPFMMEGTRRAENAAYGLEKLEENSDTLIMIPNDKLIEIAPDLPLTTVFKIADEILTNAVKGISELVTKEGLINLDFADIRAVMSSGGVALIGVGESDSEHKSEEAIQKALTNPLLDVNIEGASGALINIAGGPDLTLEQAKKAVEIITEKLDNEAKIIWGAQIYEDLRGIIKILVIITGVKSNQIIGKRTKQMVDAKFKKEVVDELGIDYLN